jgi:hypothetical protein
MGHSHALSGACAGAATGIVMHLPPLETGALGLPAAGAALMPDLDACGSCSARCLGRLSVVPSHVIRKLSGRHRDATGALARST